MAGGAAAYSRDDLASTAVDAFLGAFAPAQFVKGVTAHAGGGQGSATVLPGTFSRVDTVATGADSVAAPVLATVGAQFWGRNASANSMQLFGQGTDTINGVATGTGVAVAAGKCFHGFCVEAGKWELMVG